MNNLDLYKNIPDELKDIKDYEGFYKIDKNGTIYSLKRATTNGGILKHQITKSGYCRVGLSKNGKLKHHFVHRLVAETFIPNINNFSQVNHKNECKTDNRVENLEWCTPLYNIRYGTGIERQTQSRIGVKFTEDRKRNMSKSLKGKKPPILTAEGRMKCSIAAKLWWKQHKEMLKLGGINNE